MTISLRFAARSDVGLVRQSNQDSGYAGPHLCVLCDGMGGPAGGDIASAVAVEHLMPLDADSHQAGELLGLMRDAVQAAHTGLVTLSSQDPDLAGLGTTCIGVMRSGNKLAMVHVGDSRAYMLRDGTLTQVTTDHTFVEYLVETGRLTRDQARQHPQRSVLLRVLGDTEGEVQLDESIREAVPGDRWLLCSDGLSGPVTAETIGEVLAGVADPGQAADQLIDLALRAGGPDNVTAVVFDVVKDDPEPQTVPPVDPKIVIHVVCNQAALTDPGKQTDSEQTDSDQQADSGTGDADTDTEVEIGIGFMDGHGIISDDHVRDLAQRPDAVIRPLVPDGTPTNDDGTVTLPAHQPADPYRPSTALDEDVRIRDGYCADAGCERSAWTADLDHVTEYDHHHPHEGGQTTEANLNAKCRFGHIQKTFGDWTDDQYRDPTTGRLVTRYITPSGYIIDGDAETFEDTFPGLRRIIFRPPDTPTRRQRRRKHFDDHTRINPTRRAGTRAANKHARRRAERHRNRSRHNHDHNHNHNGDPPF